MRSSWFSQAKDDWWLSFLLVSSWWITCGHVLWNTYYKLMIKIQNCVYSETSGNVEQISRWLSDQYGLQRNSLIVSWSMVMRQGNVHLSACRWEKGSCLSLFWTVFDLRWFACPSASNHQYRYSLCKTLCTIVMTTLKF